MTKSIRDSIAPYMRIMPALTYGSNCPQHLHDWSSEQTFLQQWTDGWPEVRLRVLRDALEVSLRDLSLADKLIFSKNQSFQADLDNTRDIIIG